QLSYTPVLWCLAKKRNYAPYFFFVQVAKSFCVDNLGRGGCNGPASQQSGGCQQQAPCQYGPVAPSYIRGQAAYALHFDIQYPLDVRIQGRADASVGVDGGRHAGVGGAQHGARGFQGAHARNLQVLAQGPRFAEPAQVADVDQDGGAG